MPGDMSDPSLPLGENPVEYDRLLRQVHRATLFGGRAPARGRPIIMQSWQRSRRAGLRPDNGCRQQTDRQDALVARRPTPASAVAADVQRHIVALLNDLLPALGGDGLDSGTHLLVFTDAHGTILWRHGGAEAERRADAIGFTVGAAWGESAVGTNAIGTALAVRHPVQVHGAEHFLVSQHDWSCAAAPVIDPRSRSCAGVINLSSSVADAHPTMLALVALIARNVTLELRDAHRRALARLREYSEPMQREGSAWLIVDRWGWVAASRPPVPDPRILLPPDPAAEGLWVPSMGAVRAVPVPDGWLLEPARREREQAQVSGHLLLTPTGTGAAAELDSDQLRWKVEITRRQFSILAAIDDSEAGLSAADLSRLLFDGPDHTVTVRAEISRIRRALGPVIVASPYRFAPELEVEVRRAPQEPADARAVTLRPPPAAAR